MVTLFRNTRLNKKHNDSLAVGQKEKPNGKINFVTSREVKALTLGKEYPHFSIRQKCHSENVSNHISNAVLLLF